MIGRAQGLDRLGQRQPPGPQPPDDIGEGQLAHQTRIGGAIERTGALEDIARFMERHMAASTRGAILGVCLISGFFSAWMNNTAIVAWGTRLVMTSPATR